MQETVFISMPISELKILIIDSVNACLDVRHIPNDKQSLGDVIFDIDQAAEYIKLSVPTIHFLSSKNKIPVIKKGKKLLFSKADLTTWLMEGRKETLSEIQRRADREKA